MKTTITTCDICGYQFTGNEGWDKAPCEMSLKLESPPRQEYESVTYEHVCLDCVEAVIKAHKEAVYLRRLKQ